jgi:hypothetical protein
MTTSLFRDLLRASGRDIASSDVDDVRRISRRSSSWPSSIPSEHGRLADVGSADTGSWREAVRKSLVSRTARALPLPDTLNLCRRKGADDIGIQWGAGRWSGGQAGSHHARTTILQAIRNAHAGMAALDPSGSHTAKRGPQRCGRWLGEPPYAEGDRRPSLDADDARDSALRELCERLVVLFRRLMIVMTGWIRRTGWSLRRPARGAGCRKRVMPCSPKTALHRPRAWTNPSTPSGARENGPVAAVPVWLGWAAMAARKPAESCHLSWSPTGHGQFL